MAFSLAKGKFGNLGFSFKFAIPFKLEGKAGVAQLVEHDLAKVGVASSSLVSRSGVVIS